MPDIMLFISQFFYRIRYWLLWGTLFVTGLVIYFTQFLPYSYTVKSSLYAGITNSTSLDGASINFSVVTATFDNLISIAKSRGTLEKVSLRLLANSLTYGEEWKDNQYIQSKHYRQLLQMTPKEVLALVDRKDVEKTLANLTAYRKEANNNFVYSIFNRPVAFYSATALDGINIRRVNNSDILEISYTSADPGITQKTVSILIDELIKAYEILRFKSTNDVIAYFEEQVRLAKIKLNEEEDDLMKYNVQERVINYGEETKSLAGTRYEVEDRLEEAERIYEGAIALRKMLDEKMDIRAQIIRNNTNLLQELNKVSMLYQSIMEQEIFIADRNENKKLQKEKEALRKAENKIRHISDNLNEFNFTKEGVGIEDMVTEWLAALVNEAKAKVPSDLSIYTDETVKALKDALALVEEGKNVTEQTTVDGYADAINKAIEGLVKKNISYKVIEGEGEIFVKESGKDISIRINHEYTENVKVEVDDQEVDKVHYKVTKGSTIITFDDMYLNTLAVGTHHVKVTFEDGIATTTLVIKEQTKDDNNRKDSTSNNQETVKPVVKAENKQEVKKVKTDDTSNIIRLLSLCILSIVGGTIILKRNKE